MPEATTTAATTAAATTTTTSAVLPIGMQILSIVLMIGAIRWALLLIKDAAKHKGFAKVIRRIAWIVQLLSIVWSLVIMIVAYAGVPSTGLKVLAIIMTFIAVIGFLSIITNIRGGILLFMESGKKKGFSKRIRIVCGAIMILTLLMSFIVGI